MSRRVTAAEFAEAIAEGTVLADFYSDSCIPCKRVSPILAELEDEGHFSLVKVNVAYEQELTEQYEVQAAPTLILFRDGKETDRIRGAATKEDILDLLNEEK